MSVEVQVYTVPHFKGLISGIEDVGSPLMWQYFYQGYILGCLILCTVLPNNFFRVGHNFFPLFRSKALQKTKNWKFLWIFSPGTSPSKFYYITLVCEMELGRKFKFFPIFYYKTILFSSESEFSMKNVIFWGTSCWCSSKTKKVDGGLISCNCSLWVPLRIF